MQEPNHKQVPVYVPELVRTAYGLAIAQMYDGRTYDDFPGSCGRCGSKSCVKNGCDEVLFAKLISPQGNFVDVRVRLQNRVCNDCGKQYLSHGPFYDGATYGAPIVDMALMLSMDASSYGVERAMMNFGLQVSEDAALDYVRRFAEKAKKFAPLVEGQGSGLYAINMLKVLFGVSNAGELKEKLPSLDASSVSDETYLRKKGALRKFIEEITESGKRVVRKGMDGKGFAVDGDGKASFPDSFTLALSYLPGAEAYASLICTPQSFNQMLADILFKALEGTTFNVTDGSLNYSQVKDHVLDPVHKTRSELKHDKKFQEMKKEVREEVKKVREAKPEEKEKARGIVEEKLGEVGNYARAKYQEVLGSTLEGLRKGHPEYFDKNGDFNGHVASNCAEGGNWRLKYAVRVAHQRTDTAAGKSILAAIKDSIFTARGVKVRESLANKTGLFSFGMVMG
jgi:hypothetical protein